MKKEHIYEQHDFENRPADEFFIGNIADITPAINNSLETDELFKEHYELWLEDSGYSDWKEFYKELKEQEEMAWEMMFPEGGDDDSIMDYLTDDK